MAEVVRFAGGWLFDRVMAGWDTTVLTTDHADSRPLRILGATALDLESVLESPDRELRPEAIAVEADLCDRDPRVRRMVEKALDEGLADVRLWGERCAASVDDGVGAMRHQLSFAARAFKAQALAAAAAPFDSIDTVEMFQSGQPLSVHA